MTLPFEFEFVSDFTDADDELRLEASTRLRELKGEHTDITGASVALEELTGSVTPHTYQARVVVYIRPDNLVAVEKASDAPTALDGALDAVERQVREKRARLREQRRRA